MKSEPKWTLTMCIKQQSSSSSSIHGVYRAVHHKWFLCFFIRTRSIRMARKITKNSLNEHLYRIRWVRLSELSLEFHWRPPRKDRKYGLFFINPNGCVHMDEGKLHNISTLTPAVNAGCRIRFHCSMSLLLLFFYACHVQLITWSNICKDNRVYNHCQFQALCFAFHHIHTHA